MMFHKKNLILLLLFLVLLNSSLLFGSVSFSKQSLLSYASFVASANDVNIFVDVPLASKIVFYVPNLPSSRALLSSFRTALSSKHLLLKFNSRYNYYYVVKDLRYLKRNHFVRLHYHSFKRIKHFLKLLHLSFVFYPSINSFSFVSNSFLSLRVARFVSRVDVPISQYFVRFVIFAFNTDVSKQQGFKFSSVYKSASSSVRSVANSLVFPLSSASPFFSNVNFFSALHLLSSTDIVTVNQSPFFVSFGSSKFHYSSYLKIPYLSSSVSTSSNIATNNNSYSYKKVGLDIQGFLSPLRHSVILHLKIKIASLLKNSSNVFLPSSSVRLLSSLTRLKVGKVLVISGLKKKSISTHLLKVPFLSSIPYLGHLFTYRYNQNQISNVSIAVSVSKI